MPSRILHLCCVALLGYVLCGPAFAATPVTVLVLNSQPGDYIGQGQSLSFTPADGTFAVSSSGSTVTLSFHNSDYSQSWYLDFGTPVSGKFAKGEYVGATRTAFRSPTRPGVDVFGDGRGCNTDSGQFLVSDFILAPDGTVSRVAVDFEQHCESPSAPALYGSIRYNSSISLVPRLGIGAVSTLKGNTGTSDGLATVALSIPSANPVTVQYSAADGTAVQGVDYQSSTGTVTFPAGSTSQILVVPILGDRLARGNKQFKISLKAPSGALLGTANATALIRDPNVTMNVLAMSSESADYIGQGLQYLITPSDGTFTPYARANVVRLSINNGDGWETDFAGPGTTRLLAGEYLNAQRYPFQPAGTPGLSVYGDGRGCNTLTGNFDVLKASYNTAGVIQSFSANFEQHCEGGVPALFGWVRYHTVLQEFSVANAGIQGASAVFTVTLNPAQATTTTVTFSTVDGSAISGTDYAATTQTLAFSPGMTEQTISVPLLSAPSTPQKTFYGQLSSPSGAAVWIGRGSAAF